MGISEHVPPAATNLKPKSDLIGNSYNSFCEKLSVFFGVLFQVQSEWVLFSSAERILCDSSSTLPDHGPPGLFTYTVDE